MSSAISPRVVGGTLVATVYLPSEQGAGSPPHFPNSVLLLIRAGRLVSSFSARPVHSLEISKIDLSESRKISGSS